MLGIGEGLSGSVYSQEMRVPVMKTAWNEGAIEDIPMAKLSARSTTSSTWIVVLSTLSRGRGNKLTTLTNSVVLDRISPIFLEINDFDLQLAHWKIDQEGSKSPEGVY